MPDIRTTKAIADPSTEEAGPSSPPEPLGLTTQSKAEPPASPFECDALSRPGVIGVDKYSKEMSIPHRYAISRKTVGLGLY